MSKSINLPLIAQREGRVMYVGANLPIMFTILNIK